MPVLGVPIYGHILLAALITRCVSLPRQLLSHSCICHKIIEQSGRDNEKKLSQYEIRMTGEIAESMGAKDHTFIPSKIPQSLEEVYKVISG